MAETPAGLRYLPDFLSTDEEWTLLARLRELDYGAVTMHGQTARRRVHHWGVGYDFDTRRLRPGEALPTWLEWLRHRAAALMEVPADQVAEALATHYPPQATIGWHRDAPAFGNVVGVSLGAGCLLRFQRGAGADRRVYEQILEPRSAYLLSGPARTQWQHSIPALRQDRWSLTFRTIRRGWPHLDAEPSVPA